ncbi:MAG: malate dehydrogenase [Nanoarchaeota archaeon]|nr:malate dehydrogenase [Nanoarchaeota archaeon]
MQRPKISIIGAGNVGATTAHIASLKELGNIVLIDIVKGVAQGKGLDMSASMPIEQRDARIKGTDDYEDIKDSDIVVVTAGLPRKPGMSRDDLLKKNSDIVASVSENIKKYAPDSIVIIVSNPLDAMVYVASKVTGFPKERIIGMAGVLDSTRFAYFIAEETNVSVEDVNTMVLGGHGDMMIPLVRYSNIAGIPLSHFLSEDKIEAMVERTRKGGAEIVNLLKTGSAYYAPASAIVDMIEAILKDKKKILPCSVYLEGEYGAEGIFIGVPIKLGRNGVEEIIELELDNDEKKAFEKNVEQVRELIEKVNI